MGCGSWRSSTSPVGVRQQTATKRSRPKREPSSTWHALCERAGPDLTVALEFMPYSGVPALATAWRIVEGVPNAGLIVDGWHWARAGQQITDLAAVPGA